MRNFLSLLALFGLMPLLPADEASGVRESFFDPVDESRERTVPVKVYLGPGDGARPVVLFSHGLGGSREGVAYLGEYWAANGYVAVFLQHPGSDEDVWKDVAPRERMAAMKEAASLKNAIARIADVSFVLDELERWNETEGHELRGRLDLDRVGMSGHSFGARTTQIVMGRRMPRGRSFAEPRLDAFLPFSPSVGRGDAGEAFGHIEAPVLCVTGTEDDSPLDPSTTPESRREVYAALPAGDKYELVFDGGTHFDFSDHEVRGRGERSPRIHPAVQAISTRFWDAYLKGDEAAKQWLQSKRPREDAPLAEGDVWAWK